MMDETQLREKALIKGNNVKQARKVKKKKSKNVKRPKSKNKKKSQVSRDRI